MEEDDRKNNAGVTGTIDLNPVDPPSDADLTDHVHLLPCSIKHDGPSSVSHYFKPRKTDVAVDGLGVEEAFFRGRKLQGVTVPLPDGYRGYVLEKNILRKKKRAEASGKELSNWKSRAEFGNLTYWNHDTLPSRDDPLLRCFHWFAVADAVLRCVVSIGSLRLVQLHKPITAEELCSTSTIPGQNNQTE